MTTLVYEVTSASLRAALFVRWRCDWHACAACVLPPHTIPPTQRSPHRRAPAVVAARVTAPIKRCAAECCQERDVRRALLEHTRNPASTPSTRAVWASTPAAAVRIRGDLALGSVHTATALG